ncbi:hypothetical protein C0J52_22806 [Blattella germanica]|nr:hypothetical protein C0J52_22806 [Blattella germanica]
MSSKKNYFKTYGRGGQTFTQNILIHILEKYTAMKCKVIFMRQVKAVYARKNLGLTLFFVTHIRKE